MVIRAFVLTCAAACLWAQTTAEAPKKAPPEVDAALRARITQFYQAEVEGKFHQAEQLVAEDTKDMFVGSSKPTYYSFELQSIKYSDDFTKADVVVMVSRQLPIEGFLGHPVKSKQPSRWKIESGQWCWYIDPKTDLPSSPFHAAVPGMAAMPPGMPAPMNAPPGAPAALPPGMPMPTTGGAPGAPHAPPPMPVIPPVPMALKADKTTLELNASAASSGQVTLNNPSPFMMTVTLTDPKVPGLSVKLDRTTIASRESATLSVAWNGAPPIPARPVTVMIKVPRINQMVPVTVSFKK